MLKNLLQMFLKLLQKERFKKKKKKKKKAEAIGELIENEIADRIRKVLKTSPQNNSK